MASAWVKFRDKVVKEIKRGGKKAVKGAVANKLVSQGYDADTARSASEALTNKAEAEGGYYDADGVYNISTTGRQMTRNSYAQSSLNMPLLLGGAALIAFFALRSKR